MLPRWAARFARCANDSSARSTTPLPPRDFEAVSVSSRTRAASPSLTSLAGIAHALGVTVQYFVDTPSEERSVCRGEQLRFFGFADSANLFARLTNVSEGRQLEAILVRMPPGQKRSEVTTHAGEEFLYVIEGKCR